jgi:hypothetical protein
VGISKLDAARRQILAAIHLHWYFREPIAVYSLASNAAEICDTLLKKRDSFRLRQEIATISGCTEREIADLFNRPRNFMKHADRDPDAISPEIEDADCDAALLTACLDYMMTAGRSPYIFGIFVTWYSAIYPEKCGLFFREAADQIFPSLSVLNRREQVLAVRNLASSPVPSDAILHRSNELTDNWRWTDLRAKGATLA